MLTNNVDALPDPKILMEKIAIRDFSEFDIKDSDSEVEIARKRKEREEMMKIMELYTEKLIPAVAGSKLFHPNIRHYEPMTTAVLSTVAGVDQLRIPASTEAMAIMAYANNKVKWESMHAWKKRYPGGVKVPRYNAKKPTINAEFKEEYSNSAVGQSAWGGWSREGRMLFNKLQKTITDSRKENLARHVKIDQECVKRLFEMYKEMHKDDNESSKKQKINEDELVDDEEMDFIEED